MENIAFRLGILVVGIVFRGSVAGVGILPVFISRLLNRTKARHSCVCQLYLGL